MKTVIITLFTLVAWGQNYVVQDPSGDTHIPRSYGGAAVSIGPNTIGAGANQLPSAATSTGQLRRVSDAILPGSDVGGGISQSLLVSNGVAWVPVSGSGNSIPNPTTTATTYYIATTGSDSNVCSSTSKCLTLAHVLTLIPALLNHPYIINVADGTYAEGINFSGYTGSVTTSVSVIGNHSTPANVIFSGSIDCAGTDVATYTSGLCDTSSAYLVLNGLSFTGAVSRGVFVWENAHLVTNNIRVVGATQYGFEVSLSSTAEVLGTLLIQNFATGGSGVGVHLNLGGKFVQGAESVVTISSPAVVTSWGIDINGPGTLYEMHTGTNTSLIVSGVTIGMLLQQGSFMENDQQFVGTISFTNGSTPANSAGIYAEGGGSIFINPGTVTLTHFTDCIKQDTWGSITVKSVTFSSCGNNSTVGNAGSVNFNF